MAYNSSSASFNALLLTLPKLLAVFQGEPPTFTESPGPVDEGPNPSVDATYRSGIWDDDLRIRLGDM